VPDAGSPVTDGGIPTVGDGAVPGRIPTGIIVSPQCADCLAAECPGEVAACTADPACVRGIECLNTCIFPPLCAACFVVSGVTSVPAPIPDLNACARQVCTMCPTLG